MRQEGSMLPPFASRRSVRIAVTRSVSGSGWTGTGTSGVCFPGRLNNAYRSCGIRLWSLAPVAKGAGPLSPSTGSVPDTALHEVSDTRTVDIRIET
jgi:hypothetical protein